MSQWLTDVTDQDVIQDTVGDRLTKVVSWIDKLLSDSEYLSDQQFDFLRETQSRLDEFGDSARLTDKQFSWVRGLFERLEERRARPIHRRHR